MLLATSTTDTPVAERLTEIFQAAQKTEFYRTWLHSLDDSPEHTFDLLPHIEVENFDLDPETFHNHKRRRTAASEFVYPIQPVPSVVVLAGGFRRTAGIRVVPQFEISDISSLRCEAIAAPVGVLRRLAELGERKFEYPLIAFTGVRHGYISSSDRDLFWDRFGVPVFEQLTGLVNDVLATECEAHSGLHIRTSETIFEFRGQEVVVSSLRNLEYPVLRLALGIQARMEHKLCPCGIPGPRLVEVRPVLKAMRACAG